ncbi:unnamed protein product [Chrysoparadoxa australica]
MSSSTTASYQERLELIRTCEGLRPNRDVPVRWSFDWEMQVQQHKNDSRAAENHYRTFPLALGTILRKFGVQELLIQFSKGIWDDSYGMPSWWGAPPGVEVWVRLPRNVALEAWKGLRKSLAGLLCVSLDLLDEESMYEPGVTAMPGAGSYPGAGAGGSSESSSGQDGSVLLRASLPREAVCTENLSPLLKLLPCRSKAGLSTLLRPTRFFGSSFYSLSLQARMEWEEGSEGAPQASAASLQLAALAYFPPPNPTGPYSLQALLTGARDEAEPPAATTGDGIPRDDLCPVAEATVVAVRSPCSCTNGAFTQELPILDIDSLKSLPLSVALAPSSGFAFTLGSNTSTAKLDLGCAHEHGVRVEHFLSGRGGGGGMQGASISHITNTYDAPIKAVYSEPVKHFMVPLFSTLRVAVVPEIVTEYLEQSNTSAAAHQETQEMIRPDAGVSAGDMRFTVGDALSVLEIDLELPPHSTAVIGFQFIKKFMAAEHYPADPARGFDTLAPVVAVLPVATTGVKLDVQISPGAPAAAVAVDYIYGQAALLDLPQPDLSMPFNVITLSSTLMALLLGMALNALVRKSDGKEQPSSLKGKLAALIASLRRRKPKVKDE